MQNHMTNPVQIYPLLKEQTVQNYHQMVKFLHGKKSFPKGQIMYGMDKKQAVSSKFRYNIQTINTGLSF